MSSQQTRHQHTQNDKYSNQSNPQNARDTSVKKDTPPEDRTGDALKNEPTIQQGGQMNQEGAENSRSSGNAGRGHKATDY